MLTDQDHKWFAARELLVTDENNALDGALEETLAALRDFDLPCAAGDHVASLEAALVRYIVESRIEPEGAW
ncbi:hypothetical protein [Paraburkholderia sp. HD33-4]|uniref:hypothetical protein n=1 Tax=Paraburkholderia sp. HD33-4 TaxID=2883242 RepID=UPI001F48EC8A|nr:hypothetical protein [Paraburkholderia sp. HD33-4]